MQPTYLPWTGYLDLIQNVDEFVVLDDVQFERRSWQQRNRIKGPSGLMWITVPVLTKGRRDQRIHEVRLDPYADYPHSHIRSIETNYGKAPHMGWAWPPVRAAMASGAAEGRLVELNCRTLAALLSLVGIDTPVRRASALGISGKRSEHLASICDEIGADEYLAPPGSVDYLLAERESFDRRGVSVLIQQYEHPIWPQLFGEFLSYASSMDLLCNVGPDAGAVIRSGHRPPLSLEAA